MHGQRPSRAARLAGLALGLLAPVGALHAQTADASKALFEKAFAQRRKSAIQKIALPTTLDGRDIGVIDAQIRSDGVWLSREVLQRLLKTILLPSLQAALSSASADGIWVSAATLKSLGIEATYSSQSITLELKIPLTLRQTRVLQVDGRGGSSASASETVILPETWSLIANTRWVLSQANSGSGSVNTGRSYLEVAQRMGSWVLEGAGSVPLGAASGVSNRELTRLVRDWPEQAVRLTLGDINPATRPGLPTLALGGLQLSRRFNLNPGLNPQSQPGDKLALPAGAAIDIKANGFVARTLQLGPGVYELKDIPVFTGANDVELLIVEPGGKQTVRRFDYFFDAALLGKGLMEFDLAVGRPSLTGINGLQYSADQRITALSWRQGLLADVTVGAAAQLRTAPAGPVRVTQAEALWASRLGTLTGYVTSNAHPAFSGRSASLQWHWQSVTRPGGAQGQWSWSTLAQTSWLGAGYAALASDTPETASRDSGVRVSALAPGGLSVSASASYRTGTALTANARSLGLALRKTLNRHWSVEAVLGRQQDTAGLNQFVTISLRYAGERQPDGASQRAAMAYQSQDSRWQADTEASGISTVAGADAPWRLQAGSAYSAAGTEASLRAAMMTSRADVSAQLIGSRTPFGASRLAEASVATALVASPGGWVLTKPVSDSAALIIPRHGYENLIMYVDPMLDRSAAASDRFGPPVLTDLNAYTPREIQLDVANLPPGRGLGADRPLLKPTYRSVTRVPLGSNANVQIKGALLSAQGQPAAMIALRVAQIGKGEPVDLFTSRRGHFTSPPLPPGRYWLTIPGDAKPLQQFQIEEDQSGLLDIGTLNMPPDHP